MKAVPQNLLPHLAPGDQLNPASAGQLGATKWHYNHLPVHLPIRPLMQNVKTQELAIQSLETQLRALAPTRNNHLRAPKHNFC